MTYATPSLEDYADRTADQLKWWEAQNRQQPGDPTKLAQALVTIASEEQPPLRFVAGADAIALAEQKVANLQTQIEAYVRRRGRSLTASAADLVVVKRPTEGPVGGPGAAAGRQAWDVVGRFEDSARSQLLHQIHLAAGWAVVHSATDGYRGCGLGRRSRPRAAAAPAYRARGQGVQQHHLDDRQNVGVQG